MPSSIDTSKATNDLADALASTSVWIFNYRRSADCTDDVERLRNLENVLDRNAIALRAKAIELLGDEIAEALQSLTNASKDVEAFMDDVKDAKKALSITTAVIALAGAALTGDTHAIVKSAVGLGKELKDVV